VHGKRLGVDLIDLGQLDVDGCVITANSAQRKADIVAGQLRSCELVEERLELMVIVAIDQGDAHRTFAARQLQGTSQAGKASADDYYVFGCGSRGHDGSSLFFLAPRMKRWSQENRSSAYKSRLVEREAVDSQVKCGTF
jgi:hypothetical protein